MLAGRQRAPRCSLQEIEIEIGTGSRHHYCKMQPLLHLEHGHTRLDPQRAVLRRLVLCTPTNLKKTAPFIAVRLLLVLGLNGTSSRT